MNRRCATTLLCWLITVALKPGAVGATDSSMISVNANVIGAASFSTTGFSATGFSTTVFSTTVFSTTVFSTTISAHGYQLEVLPTLCVLDEGEQSCQLPLRLHWRSDTPLTTAICLYADDQREPLLCDQSGRVDVSATLDFTLTRNTRIELRQQQDGKLLALTDITLARVIPELRPRRRHGWGIF